jgi:hypothetical protein
MLNGCMCILGLILELVYDDTLLLSACTYILTSVLSYDGWKDGITESRPGKITAGA